MWAEIEIATELAFTKNDPNLKGPLFVAGKSEECQNKACGTMGNGIMQADCGDKACRESVKVGVLAFIGWQHEHEKCHLEEIEKELNLRGVEVNERNVGSFTGSFWHC